MGTESGLPGPLFSFGALGALLVAGSLYAGPPEGMDTEPSEACTTILTAIRESDGLPGEGAARRPFPRLRLFGTPCGCASAVFARMQDDPPDPTATDDGNDPLFAGLDVWVGNDNPYFDIRHPDRLGGVGFYRVNADYSLIDDPDSRFVVHCRAVTPAGLDAGGVEHGPTIVRPGFTWSQALGRLTAAQAFVETKLLGGPRAAGGFEESFRYGFAVQRALTDDSTADGGDVFLFVQALGRNTAVAPPGSTGGARLGLIPGIRWEPDESFWLSGGVLFGSKGRAEPLIWQITCACRF